MDFEENTEVWSLRDLQRSIKIILILSIQILLLFDSNIVWKKIEWEKASDEDVSGGESQKEEHSVTI